MSQPFSVSVHAPAVDVRVVAVGGEVDLFTVPEVKRKVDQALQDGANRLIIDLTETSFIDSTGLGLLLGTLRRVGQRQGVMAVVNTSQVIGMTFGMTGLDQVLTVVSSRQEALDLVGAGQGQLTPA